MDAVPELLHDLKNQPVTEPRSGNGAKSENPVRVSMIFGNGVGGFSAVRWIQLLSCTPDCVFTAVSGADVRAGRGHSRPIVETHIVVLTTKSIKLFCRLAPLVSTPWIL